MARAGGNSRRTWQPLNSALDPIIEEFGSREFAQRHVLDRLIRKELPCRYLAVDGVRHESDLPELFGNTPRSIGIRTGLRVRGG